jgi:hypothetical protein
MRTTITAICFIAVASLAVGCGSSAPHTGKTAVPAGAASGVSCGTLSQQWANTGGGSAGLGALGSKPEAHRPHQF